MPIGFVAPSTKEHVHVDLEDRTGLITDLSGSGPTFTVLDSADVAKVTDVAATGSGLRITCLLDTTVGGVWAEGEYRLFVKFSVGSEVVVKGPYYFIIADD